MRTALCLVLFAGAAFAQEPPFQGGGRGGGPSRVYKARVTPHWLGEDRFWYRNDLQGGDREYVLVDADKGTRAPAFDHAKLAAGLSKAAGTDYRATRLPIDDLSFADGAVVVEAAGKKWKCDLATYAVTEAGPARKKAPATVPVAPPPLGDESPFAEAQAPTRQPGRGEAREVTSPDGKLVAFVRDANVFVRPKDGGDAVQLSTTGTAGNAFGMLNWSPDSAKLVAFRVEPGDAKEVYLVESSPPGGGRAKLETRPYPLPGDRFTAYEPWVFDVPTRSPTKVDADKLDFGRPAVRWAKDGKTFTYQKVDRGHQRFRLVEVNAVTGKARNVIDEKSNTFIWTAHTESMGTPLVTWLTKTDELIYSSEASGWRHLYLVDRATGRQEPITKGEYVVRGIDRIDEDKRQLWFRAAGYNVDQDPYHVHHYRVNFDGTGLVALTAGNGTHAIEYSPGRKYLIDSYSRVDLAPVHELRRVADGKLVCKLEEADVSDLKASGWRPMEPFVAKGRDGTTDIWGVIARPRDFDPAKKYPVVESIYAGPQGAFVPKAFTESDRYATLTNLGFVVVQIDGMGTAYRSKKFHDACWHDLADAGFPDRILWHKAVAAKYAWYDVSRVGVYGTSAGGQNAMGALLFHGDFYKAAMAACGCHDNRMDKASWNEQWMGYPVGPHYAASSNVDNAKKLSGKLLLIVGEKDTNVPPESTYRVCDALIKAGKDFDFVMVPGMGHSNGGAYGTRRTQDFFVRHLMGKEPPDRNK